MIYRSSAAPPEAAPPRATQRPPRLTGLFRQREHMVGVNVVLA